MSNLTSLLTKIIFIFFYVVLICFFKIDLQACVYRNETPLVNFLKPANASMLKSGVELVDRIYVINLDKRPEKWQRMQQILKERKMRSCRFSAIDGWNISDESQQILAGNYPVRMLPGEVGCLLSHVSVMKDALKKGFKVVWIMEDDIEFIEDPHTLSDIIAQLSKIDPNWDVLYTDIDSKNNQGVRVPALDADFRPDREFNFPLDNYLIRTPISEDIMKLGQRYGMYSVLISRKGLKKIYNYFSHVYLWCAIDIDIHYIPTIREYSTTRDIVSIWCHSPFSDTKEGS